MDILIDGDKIRVLRQKKHWSQNDLARVSGVFQGAISRLEANRQTNTRADTLIAVARALGVRTDELLVDGTPPVPDEPSDPQIDVFMHLVEDMTTEERASAEMFVRFVLDQRKKAARKKRRQKKSV